MKKKKNISHEKWFDGIISVSSHLRSMLEYLHIIASLSKRVRLIQEGDCILH